MTILTVTAKGQITLRKALLEHLGVGPGDKVRVNELPDGRVELARPGGAISDIFDLLKRPQTPRLSVEEINEATAAGWAGEA